MQWHTAEGTVAEVVKRGVEFLDFVVLELGAGASATRCC
jgi:hypothetical protein